MTILPDLEAQLLELADRAASPARRRRRRLPAGALPTTLAAAAALAVAAIAIIALGNRSHTSTSPESPPVPPAASRLVSELAVLRRPQTPADLKSTYLDLFLRNGVPTPPRGRLGQPIRSLIRLAAITPWGEKVFLVPVIAPDRTATLALVAGGSSCCSTAADIAAGQAGLLSGSGGPGSASRNSVVSVFPDGVAKVTFLLPRQGIPGEPAYNHRTRDHGPRPRQRGRVPDHPFRRLDQLPEHDLVRPRRERRPTHRQQPQPEPRRSPAAAQSADRAISPCRSRPLDPEPGVGDPAHRRAPHDVHDQLPPAAQRRVLPIPLLGTRWTRLPWQDPQPRRRRDRRRPIRHPRTGVQRTVLTIKRSRPGSHRVVPRDLPRQRLGLRRSGEADSLLPAVRNRHVYCQAPTGCQAVLSSVTASRRSSASPTASS